LGAAFASCPFLVSFPSAHGFRTAPYSLDRGGPTVPPSATSRARRVPLVGLGERRRPSALSARFVFWLCVAFLPSSLMMGPSPPDHAPLHSVQIPSSLHVPFLFCNKLMFVCLTRCASCPFSLGFRLPPHPFFIPQWEGGVLFLPCDPLFLKQTAQRRV